MNGITIPDKFITTVAAKAPKRLHLSGSESTSFRVAAATAQKNLGTKYLLKVCLSEEIYVKYFEEKKTIFFFYITLIYVGIFIIDIVHSFLWC